MITKIIVSGVILLVSVALLISATTAALVAGLGGGLSTPEGPSSSGGYTGQCAATGTPGAPAPGYSREQVTNASIIVAVGKRLRVPQRGIVAAVAAAIQESGLRNLPNGDRDSLGLFQQRPSQGWGTPAQVTDPTYASTAFYRHLLAIPNWQTMTVNDIAQTVQKSATPNAYGRHEPAARTLTATLAGVTCAPDPAAIPKPADGAAPTQAARQAIAFARAQIGTPYRWGGNGPTDGGFDCSGLTTAAYAAADIRLPRTAHTQYHATQRIPDTELQPGDLVFYGNPTTKIRHVGLYIGANLMIDAPTYGRPVGIHPTRRTGDDYAGAGRVTTTRQ